MVEIRKMPDGVAEGADYLRKWSTARVSGRWRDDPDYKRPPKKGKREKKKSVGKMSLRELMR